MNLFHREHAQSTKTGTRSKQYQKIRAVNYRDHHEIFVKYDDQYHQAQVTSSISAYHCPQYHVFCGFKPSLLCSDVIFAIFRAEIIKFVLLFVSNCDYFTPYACLCFPQQDLKETVMTIISISVMVVAKSGWWVTWAGLSIFWL